MLLAGSKPAQLVWKYEGKEEWRHGEQCCHVGDTVYDDMLGKLEAVRIEGGFLIQSWPSSRSFAQWRSRMAAPVAEGPSAGGGAQVRV